MNESKLTIGIITFRQRKELIRDLVAKIRSSVPTSVDIILAINGNNEEDMPEEYRQDMLDLAKQYVGIYPIFCPEFKSICKLFNTFIIFSKTEHVFIMGDDVEYGNPDAYDIIIEHIEKTKQEFFKINNGFSHFVCTKSIMHKLGYFDERLCGFGEEDGDILHRYIRMTGSWIPSITIPNIYNKAAYHLKNEKIENHQDNKPRFNREFVKLAYVESPDGICGMNPTPIKKVIPDYQQYPYEEFVRKNKHNIAKFEKIILD
jgi:hypothetical protein